jgi:hypothetical protein
VNIQTLRDSDEVEQNPPERCLQPDYEFRAQHIRNVTSVAIRADKFLLLIRRFRKSVGEFYTIGCFN